VKPTRAPAFCVLQRRESSAAFDLNADTRQANASVSMCATALAASERSS
jgi:hypothetical protein